MEINKKNVNWFLINTLLLGLLNQNNYIFNMYHFIIIIFIFYDRTVSIDELDSTVNDQNNQLATKQQIKV
jgi:hypothetical protein